MVFITTWGANLLVPYLIFFLTFLFIAVLFVLDRYKKKWQRVSGIFIAFFVSWFVPFPIMLLYILIDTMNTNFAYLILAVLIGFSFWLSYKSYKDFF